MRQEIDREKIKNLLKKYASNEFAKDALAGYICEKAFDKGHLYSDMGLSSRVELNRLMADNYPQLASKRPPSIRWKKFLFDEISSTAPACYGCLESQNCFKCDILEAV